MARKTKKIEKEIEEKPLDKKEQIKRENKILRNFLIGVGVFILLIIAFVLFIKSTNNFTYNGVDFEVVREGNLVLYKTQLPVVFEGRDEMYNFYLRNDPRKTVRDVNFKGQLVLLKNTVINSTSDFNCNGDGVIAIANLATLYDVIGSKIIRDENATCDPEGKYVYLNLKEGDKTEVKQTGVACYDITINNCEILQGTERFMIEAFSELDKMI